MVQSNSSSSTPWMVWIFLGIFVMVGIGAMGFGLRDAYRSWQSSSWPVAEGRILKSSVETHSDSDGTSYSAAVSYRFVLGKETYDGDKVVLGAVSASYDTAASMVNRYPAGTQVKIHYHPQDPSLCVLEPGLRPSSWIFPGVGLLFAGFGLLFIWAISFRGKKRPQGTNPWEHKRWRDGIARHQLGLATGFAFFMGTAFAGVGSGILAANSREALLREKPLLAFGLGFLLVGTGILTYALISLFRWFRFHGCFVQMRTIPGVIGGTFAGFLTLPRSFPDDADVRLELCCEATTTTPGRGNRDSQTSTSVEWSRKLCVHPSARQHGLQAGVPFEFTIPYGLHDETDEHQNASSGVSISYAWHFRATATLPGADLDLKFPVPVFKTKESDPGLKHVPEPGEELPLEKYLEEQGEKQRIHIETGAEGPVYVGAITPVVWPAFLIPGIFALVFLGVGIGLPIFTLPEFFHGNSLHAPKGFADGLFMLLPLAFGIIPVIISVAFFGFGALMLAITLKELVSRRTWIAHGYVHQRRRFLGILPLPGQRLSCQEVGSVRVGGGSSSGGKSYSDINIEPKERTLDMRRSKIQAFLKANASITIATSVPTRRETDKIIKDLRNAINQQRNIPIDDEAEESQEDAPPDPEEDNRTPTRPT